MLPRSIVEASPRPLSPALSVPRIGGARVRWLASVALPFAVYLAVGLVFSLGAEIITGDSWSRVGNAYYVLFSRDPHLAAIGFVWNPLPSLVELPLLPFAALWRPIVDHGVAGNLMSAAFMALAVRELWLWLRDLGTPRVARIALLLAFAAHPLILLYGGNGMSEAPFLFFLLLGGRAFSSWLTTSAVSRLAVAGIALAFAYLTRYEAIGPIAAIGLLTAIVSFARASGTRRERVVTAAADALILGAPPAAAFLLWALASWIIVGSPFETFTSVYGNSSQVGLTLEGIRAATGQTFGAALAYLIKQILGLEPLLPVAVALAVVVAIKRRDLRVLVPLGVFGSVMAFSGLLFLSGGSFGWLRFSIGAVPLTVVALGIVLSGLPTPRRGAGLVQLRDLAVAGAVAVALVAVPVGVNTVFDASLAREESPQLHGLIAGDREVADQRQQFLVAGDIAHYLDSQNLQRGSVVVDVAIGFEIVLQSRHPEQFVITPDRDFQQILADPATFSARYLLVPSGAGYSALDAVTRAYPALFANGEGSGSLVQQFGSGVFAWRLYRVGA